MSNRFPGASVFITGASAGIGAAMARAFAKEGAKVALAARRKDRLTALATEIESAGGSALPLACDVTDRASIDAAVAQTVETFGGLDIAIANAGFGVNGTFESLETEDYRRQFDTNFFGAIDTAKAALPHLIASRGRLVFVSSVLGRVAAPAYSAYTASKFALCGFADSIYYELADHGVSVTCIEPGLIQSDFRMTDNKGRFHDNRSEPSPKWIVMPAPKAAQKMLRAIQKRKPEAIITHHGKFAVFLCRHFPASLRAAMRQGTKGRMARLEKARRNTR